MTREATEVGVGWGVAAQNRVQVSPQQKPDMAMCFLTKVGGRGREGQASSDSGSQPLELNGLSCGLPKTTGKWIYEDFVVGG